MLAERSSARPLVGVLAAMAVSLTGTRVSAIAVPWFVLVTTGSAAQTGLVAFCEMAPYVVVKALTGPLVDRAGPRVVSWTTDLVSAVAAALLPVLVLAGVLPFWLLLVLVAVIGAARGPGDLAKEIMVPEAARRGRVPLERATGLSGVVERLAQTVGPSVGGGLIALFGPLTGLGVIAGCFAAGSVIIAVALPHGMGRGSRAEDDQDGYWRSFGEGVRFLRGDRLLLALVCLISVTNLLDAAFSSVLLPVWAKESGHGPSAIGVAVSVGGISAVGGSLIAALVAHRLPRRLVFFAAFLLAGAPRFLVLASGAPLWTVFAVFAVGGFGAGFLNPILGAIMYERIPQRMLGRVGALSDSLSWAGMPLGGLIAGGLVAWLGVVPALVACGLTYALTTTLGGLRPEWREMRRTGEAVSAGG
jgi:MFS family permease